MSSDKPILRLTDGLRLGTESVMYGVPPLRLYAGQWVAFVPEGADPATDPAGMLSRCLISLSPPQRGSVEIYLQDAYNISYRDVQRLRSKLGFVQGYGGLLSNRSIRENVALPISEHTRLSVAEETQLLDRFIKEFNLDAVEDQRPHVVDGFTRWRTCLARALILSPRFVVLEGIGDWSMDSGKGVAWRQLTRFHDRGDNVVCVCTSRRNRGFETWFQEKGGVVIEYKERRTEKEPVK